MGSLDGIKRWSKRVAPYAITLLVVVLILREHPLDAIVLELARGDVWPMALIAPLLFLTSLFWVSLADHLVVQHALRRLPFLDFVRAKAASSLLDIVGYAWGHGGYAFWIGRRTGHGAHLAAGTMLYIMAADLTALCLLGTLALPFGALDTVGRVALIAPAVGALMLFFIAIGPLGLFAPTPKVFMAWRTVPRSIGLLQVAIRAGQMALFISATWLAATGFGLEIPFAVMAGFLPIIMVIGAMPINVAGFGLVQASWLLFEPWATGPEILAFQFLWSLVTLVTITLRGLPFVRGFVREIAEGRAAESEVQASAAQRGLRDHVGAGETEAHRAA